MGASCFFLHSSFNHTIYYQTYYIHSTVTEHFCPIFAAATDIQHLTGWQFK